ncbi:hypothetical protein K439DRAFT_1610612 [Ramaria rubella]|nr:hypothetical protein K439DRAFT_1610612 [Ramaria rubella]
MDLVDTIDHFLQATKCMSSSKIPRIFEVIPIIDVLTATLDQYLSDNSLFPATLYFQCQKWPESWVDTAVSLVREQWEHHYKPQNGLHTTVTKPTVPGYFAELDSFGVLDGIDELDKYLGLPAQPLVATPLQHWETQCQGGSQLAHMALDYLLIPDALEHFY